MIGGVFCGFWCGCWGFCGLWKCCLSVFLGGVRRFFCKMILFFENCLYLCSPKTESNSPVAVFETSSGCSSARLEYTSGGRGVASSNLVTPTKLKQSLWSFDRRLCCFREVCQTCVVKPPENNNGARFASWLCFNFVILQRGHLERRKRADFVCE